MGAAQLSALLGYGRRHGVSAALFEGCFPELFGFVLLDPAARLDHALAGNVADMDLLGLFTSTGLGDHVAEEGIAIPVLGVEASLYSVLVRHAANSAPWITPQIVSGGWVLGTTTGELLLCGAGYLSRWDPDDPRHRRIGIPPGWDEAEIRGHVLSREPNDPPMPWSPARPEPTRRADGVRCSTARTRSA